MEHVPLPIISHDFVKVVIPLIDNAVNTIDIIVFHWRFYRDGLTNPVSLFNDSIKRAVARGVKVRCLVSDDRTVLQAQKLGCLARRLYTKRLLHNKLLIIDGVGVVLGSHNYTQHAFSSNHETSIFVVLESQKNSLVQYFNDLFGFS